MSPSLVADSTSGKSKDSRWGRKRGKSKSGGQGVFFFGFFWVFFMVMCGVGGWGRNQTERRRGANNERVGRGGKGGDEGKMMRKGGRWENGENKISVGTLSPF